MPRRVYDPFSVASDSEICTYLPTIARPACASPVWCTQKASSPPSQYSLPTMTTSEVPPSGVVMSTVWLAPSAVPSTSIRRGCPSWVVVPTT